ncbi:hypothetical protein KIW84_024756 [Lathyrus oleraceus]|uniref:DUF4283 domain-containing protein n=1 Tax=Pisum sativum TaxID=3888 RepID=A0A9D4YHA4_PEA|nr:hypothetical protein KIW84_024756 [Pisum sativum]
MHFESFWIRVYDLPLKLRSEVMAKQLWKIIGEYEEVDPKEANRMDMFLRIKVKIDLWKPLKGGTLRASLLPRIWKKGGRNKVQDRAAGIFSIHQAIARTLMGGRRRLPIKAQYLLQGKITGERKEKIKRRK